MRTFAPDELTEIRDSYRNAANPKKQIGILSDLYDCAEQDIQQALGLPVTPAKPKPSTGRKQKRAYVQWQKDQVKEQIKDQIKEIQIYFPFSTVFGARTHAR